MADVRIIDGFYSDPVKIRDGALASTWVDAWGSWNGLHSLERAPETQEQLFRIAALISSAEPNWEELDASYRYWNKASCGGFAAMFESQTGVIHAHRRSGDWAGVVYLSLPEHSDGRDGTLFYRHRDTGLECYDNPDSADFQKALADAEQSDAWELIEAVPMRFNRLVLFDSHYFHGASAGFGSSLADCRLIQVFNFSFLPGSER